MTIELPPVVGMPPGGLVGQALLKESDDDFDAGWGDVGSGGSGFDPHSGNDKKILHTRIVSGTPVFSWEPTTPPAEGQWLRNVSGASVWDTIEPADISAVGITDGYQLVAVGGHGQWTIPRKPGEVRLKEDCGAYGDSLTNYNASISAGSPIVTIAGSASNGRFTNTDTGKTCFLARAKTDSNYINNQGTIVAEMEYLTTTTCKLWQLGSGRTVAVNADLTCVDTAFTWGHDDTAAAKLWYTNLPGTDAEGGSATVPSGGLAVGEPGRYLVRDDGSGMILKILKTGCRFQGQGSAGNQPQPNGINRQGGCTFVLAENVTMFQSGQVPPTKTVHQRTTINDIGFEDVSEAFASKGGRFSGSTHFFMNRCSHVGQKYACELDPIGSKDSSWGHVRDIISNHCMIAIYAPQHSVDVTAGDFQVDIGQAGIVRGGDLYLKINPHKQDHQSAQKYVVGRQFDHGLTGSPTSIDLIPSTPNGHRYTPTVIPAGAGPLLPTEPTWPTSPGASVTISGWTFKEAGPVFSWDGDTLQGPMGVAIGRYSRYDSGTIVGSGGAGKILGLSIEHHNELMDEFYDSIGVRVFLAKSGISISNMSSGGGTGNITGINQKTGTGIWIDGVDDTGAGKTQGVDIGQSNLSNWRVGLRLGPHSKNTSVTQMQSSGGNTTHVWIESGSVLNWIDLPFSASNTTYIQDDNTDQLANLVTRIQGPNDRQWLPIVAAAGTWTSFPGDIFLVDDGRLVYNVDDVEYNVRAPKVTIAMFLSGTLPASAADTADCPMISPVSGTIVGLKCYAKSAPSSAMDVQLRKSPDANTPTFADATGLHATFVSGQNRARDTGSVAVTEDDILNFSITSGSGSTLLVEAVIQT